MKRVLKLTAFVIASLAIGLFLFFNFYAPPLSKNHGRVDTQLFVGESSNQPLIVAFGGSQGGNTWTEDYWAEMRDRFLRQGYAVLSVGYFNTENTPKMLDRISLNAIYNAIKTASNHPKIKKHKIALLGSSKGGELVLNLASRYPDMDAVVALVPSHITFPAATITGNTSSWTYNDQEIATFTMPYKAYLPLIQGDLQRSLKMIFEDGRSSEKAEIEVEKINGPILIVSAKDDELWPSKFMSDKIVQRLKEKQFKYYYNHYSFKGRHHDTKNYFEVVFKFLDEHFKLN